MGRTFTEVEVENYNDVVRRAESGNGHERVRELKVRALIDTGSALLCLHRSDIEKLGLILTRTAKVRTGAGEVERRIYAVALIRVLGRWCSAEVMEIPDTLPPLLGYILLEGLDLVIHPKTHKVIANPESGGKWMLDLLHADDFDTEVQLLRRNHALLTLLDELKRAPDTIPLAEAEAELR